MKRTLLSLLGLLTAWSACAQTNHLSPELLPPLLQASAAPSRVATGSARQMAPQAATLRYVKAGASGTGASWDNASGDLQAMINASAAGDQVWIAGGTYKPSTTGLTDTRTAAFSLKNGVSVLGGFTGTAGTEGNISTRIAIPSSTTLSGDIGTIGDNSDNSYHVVFNNFNGLDNSAILDGVTIAGGNANSPISGNVNRFGGGMFNRNIAPTILNCLFTQNHGEASGGLDNASCSGTRVVNCSFVNNTSSQAGGAFDQNSTNTVYINCFFGQNSSRGFFAYAFSTSTSTPPTLTNCTFRNNSPNAIVTDNSTPSLVNCLLWDNGGQNAIFGSGVTARYSLIEAGETNYTNGGNNQTLTTSPFDNATGPALKACAPAVDAGNGAANTTTTTDVLGNARKLRNIDVGAAEFQGTPTQPALFSNQSQSATAVCAGQNVTLAADLSGTGPFTVEVFRDNTSINRQNTLNSGGRIALSPSINQSGSYQFVATSACNSVTTTFASITANPLPTAYSVTGGGAYCTGNAGSVVGLSGSQTGVSYQLLRGGSATGTPLAGTGNPVSFGPQSTTGTYTVRATNATTACTQTMSGSAVVSFNALPTVSITPSTTTICAGQSTLLAASGANTYRWNTEATTAAISVSAMGPYSVTGTTTTTGCSNTATANVTVTPLPNAGFTGLPTSVCVDAGPSTLTPTTSGGTFSGPGISGNQFSPATAGAGGPYSITYTVSNQGCPNTSVQSVTVKPLPTVSIVPSSLSGCAGQIITLSAQGADRYAWSTGQTTTSIPVTATGTMVYSVTGTTSSGCSASASQSITIYPLPSAPGLLTQQGQAYPGGQSSVSVDLNSGNVNLVVSGCNGTLSWSGPNGTSGSTSPIVVSTGQPGRFVYQATCTTNGCTSPASSATVTVQGRLTVLHRDVDNYATNNSVQPLLVLQNQGRALLPLSAITLRYYLTVEGNNALSNLSVNYAQVGNQNVRLRYVPLSPIQQGASGYVEVSFTAGAGSLAAGANSGPIQAYFAKGDYGTLNETDDYSYNPVRDQLTSTLRITAYYNGVLIAGIEPGSTTQIRAIRALTESRNGPSATQINTVLEVRNEGTVPVNYSELSARYYFTSDGNERLQVELDEGNVSAQLVALSQPVAGANYYLEIRYNQGGQLAPGASTGAIRYRISKPDGGRFNQANDYSYQEQPAERSQNSQVVVLVGTDVVWGTLPMGTNARLAFNQEPGTNLEVTLLGNPTRNDKVSVQIKGAGGESLQLQLVSAQGRIITQQQIDTPQAVEQHDLSLVGQGPGVFLLQVSTPTQSRTIRVLKVE